MLADHSKAHRESLPVGLHGFVWGCACLLVVIIAIASQLLWGSEVWSEWTESSGLRRPSYAERVHVDDLLRTRANAWSNLAYVIVGLYAMGLAGHDARQDMATKGYLVKTPAMSLAFGMACCYLGFGSGLFHASLTRFGQQLDVASMYAPLLMMIAINLGRWVPGFTIRRKQIPTWPILVSLVVVISAFLFVYKWSMSSMNVLSTLILIVGLLALFDQVQRVRLLNYRWLIGSSLALGLAVLCRELDVAGRFSGPDAWLQGHAIWHVLTSLSIGCMYFYFRGDYRDADRRGAPGSGPGGSVRRKWLVII